MLIGSILQLKHQSWTEGNVYIFIGPDISLPHYILVPSIIHIGQDMPLSNVENTLTYANRKEPSNCISNYTDSL